MGNIELAIVLYQLSELGPLWPYSYHSLLPYARGFVPVSCPHFEIAFQIVRQEQTAFTHLESSQFRTKVVIRLLFNTHSHSHIAACQKISAGVLEFFFTYKTFIKYCTQNWGLVWKVSQHVHTYSLYGWQPIHDPHTFPREGTGELFFSQVAASDLSIYWYECRTGHMVKSRDEPTAMVYTSTIDFRGEKCAILHCYCPSETELSLGTDIRGEKRLWSQIACTQIFQSTRFPYIYVIGFIKTSTKEFALGSQNERTCTEKN